VVYLIRNKMARDPSVRVDGNVLAYSCARAQKHMHTPNHEYKKTNTFIMVKPTTAQ